MRWEGRFVFELFLYTAVSGVHYKISDVVRAFHSRGFDWHRLSDSKTLESFGTLGGVEQAADRGDASIEDISSRSPGLTSIVPKPPCSLKIE